jgi:hypothetical protein
MPAQDPLWVLALGLEFTEERPDGDIDRIRGIASNVSTSDSAAADTNRADHSRPPNWSPNRTESGRASRHLTAGCVARAGLGFMS